MPGGTVTQVLVRNDLMGIHGSFYQTDKIPTWIMYISPFPLNAQKMI